MDARLYSIQSKLPQDVISSLEENRGNGNAIWSLLEIYRENNYISAEEETVLYNEYIIVTANHGVHLNNVQPENQYAQQGYAQYAGAQQNYGYQNPQAQQNYAYQNMDPQQYAMQQESRQKAEVAYQQLKKGKRHFIVGLVVAALSLMYILIFSSVGFSEVEMPENFADNIHSIASGTEYFIKDAVILGGYAEYFEAPENLTGDQEIPDGQKNVTDVFYIAIVTDNNDKEYIVSLSFDADSDIARTLENYDFENDVYEFSAYFEAKTFSSFVSEITEESVSDFYDEFVEEVNYYFDYTLEAVDWDFEYVHSEDYDYEENAETGRAAFISVTIVFGLLLVGMVVLAIKGKKNQKKAAAELAQLGYTI